MARWGKRKAKINLKRRVFISILIFLLLFLQFFIYIDRKLEPILMSIAQARVKQIATNAVNDAISKKIAQNTNFKDLIEFETDNEGNIKAAMFNYAEYARIVGESTARVEETLNDLEKMEESIKLGAAFDSEILADYGPSIPIVMRPIGSVQVNPLTTYQSAGINVTIMTVVINIRAEVQVVIPFVTEPTIIETSVPIAQTQIFGEVPQFYYYGGTYYNQDPYNTPNAPPIQIVPGTPTVPGNSEIEVTPDAIPSNSANNNNGLPGLEQFYPIIPRDSVPTSGTF